MISLNAPAKINWFLNVLHKRDDGYHNIVSLMQCVTLNDKLMIEHSDTIEIFTDAAIPKEDNLVYKAAMLMKKRSGVKAGARINLKKEIPVAAGLGGGSSDAATALMGLKRLWNLDLTQNELLRLGETLGSDVPFFFNGPISVIEGRGEVVSPVKVNISYPILLVKPPVNVSTKWAYTELDKVSSSREVLTKGNNVIKLFCQALEKGDFSLLSTIQRNDFDALVVRRYPAIGEIKQKLIERGALFSAMSGSGPTVFGVFDSEEKALKAMGYMLPNWCRVVKTIVE